MADYTSFNDLAKLTELLNPKQNENSESEDEEISTNTYKALTPGTITKTNSKNESKTKYKQLEPEKKGEVLDPEEEFSIDSGEVGQGTCWKKTPQWEVAYKQSVTSQDVFLQMGGKTPSTFSCEDMIISVHLPGEKRQNIDLKILRDRLDLISPNYRLNIPLPHTVDPQKGNAEFDTDTEKIKITLRMDREFDYINF